MKPPVVRGAFRSHLAAMAQAELALPMPLSTKSDKSLFCPLCGTYKPHHQHETLFRVYVCRTCGRVRNDDKP